MGFDPDISYAFIQPKSDFKASHYSQLVGAYHDLSLNFLLKLRQTVFVVFIYVAVIGSDVYWPLSQNCK